MTLLEARLLKVLRGERMVLNGLSLSLEDGEKICITGANGSGKTTLLESLLGFIPLEEGEIFFKGQPLKGEKDFQLFRPQAGYVFQEPDDQLFSPTVEEELAFGPLNLGMEREKISRVIDDTLERLAISKLKQSATFRLSGGEKKLVALASVLVMDPPLFLLDETTAGLDPYYYRIVFNLLKDTPKSVVLVTHDADTIRELKWRTYLLEEGRLREV